MGEPGDICFPGLAVAEALAGRQHRVQLLVSEKAVDQVASTAMAAFPDRSRVGVRSISAIGYGGFGQLIRFCRRMMRATRDCAGIYHDFKPDVVLGMGGFTSAPAVLAARWSRVRAVIHESNAVPGQGEPVCRAGSPITWPWAWPTARGFSDADP